MPLLSQKGTSIRELVQRLRERLGAASFVVVDHWQQDPFAIGIANPQDPRVLAYINTGSETAARYFLSFETPPLDSWANPAHRRAGEHSVETIDEIALLIQTRLAA
jgi:hypothetical protein